MRDTFSSMGQQGRQIAEGLEQARSLGDGDLPLGIALARQAWDEAVEQGYVEEQLEAGRLLSRFHMRRGELSEMLQVAQQLLPLQRAQGASTPLCHLLRTMALGAAELGDFETALACANENMAAARELGDPRLVSVALNAIGACFERMGDPWQAVRLMNEATALLGGQATDYELMVAQNNLATVALGTYHLLNHSGHERECKEALQRALDHALQARPHALALADPYPLALTDGNRGEVLMHLGRLDEAEDLLLSALEVDRQCGYLALSWRVRCSLAELALKRGHLAEALADLQALLHETQGRDLGGTTLMRLQQASYRAHKALGHGEAALLHLEQVQFLEHRRGVAQLMAQARFFVSRLEAEQSCGGAGAESATVMRAQVDDDELLRDPLTGLGNRRCMESRMPALMRAAERGEAPLTLALIDVDRLAAINAEHGTAVGDRVLQALAQMLKDNTRGRDLLLRWSGEEILVVLPDTIPDRAFEVCERLRQAVEGCRWSELSPGLDVTLSIGLANAPPYATDLLIARAHSAMERAKHLGRNLVALA
ncbi:tetratricopeptide repeat-containing diguanylate cyclase [Pelomonas sp. KK5]|uniref:tetratricopeptide repeat-containing diguanylate cyclase n=1 Tax=Pelomonas sp. KK5 TaxID=1855730 RepID=UPI001180DABD|nr:tetratricopeptide repeat-containing diguanylate cyclase [Pelomonas sp. KK5]